MRSAILSAGIDWPWMATRGNKPFSMRAIRWSKASLAKAGENNASTTREELKRNVDFSMKGTMVNCSDDNLTMI